MTPRALLLAFLLLPGLLNAEALPAPVVDGLARAGVPMSAVSAYVQKVGSSDVLLDLHGEQPMNPASVMKLVTTFAALELLGPAYTYKTEVYTAGEMKGGTLTGDLYLKGSGDPKLNYERFWQLLTHLRERGLRSLHGDLVIDRSAFLPVQHDPARFDGEPLKPYNVGPDAALLNLKVVRFFFTVLGKRVLVYAEPDMPGLKVEANVQVAGGSCGDWRERIQRSVDIKGEAIRVRFTGSYPASCGDGAWNVGLYSQDVYALNLFRQLWPTVGGVHKGGVRTGTVPDGAELLYTHESPPLADIIRDVNKFSNNVMARQLFLTLSIDPGRRGGDAATSERMVKDWLKQKGIEMPELVMENGSGLSRKERMSARSVVALLQAAFRSPVLGDLLASLPLVGSDGTMKKRTATDGALGYAHIKGGTLTGVRTIAGYVLDRSGQRWAVALFINHPNAANLQPVQDAFLQWVYAR